MLILSILTFIELITVTNQSVSSSFQWNTFTHLLLHNQETKEHHENSHSTFSISWLACKEMIFMHKNINNDSIILILFKNPPII